MSLAILKFLQKKILLYSTSLKFKKSNIYNIYNPVNLEDHSNRSFFQNPSSYFSGKIYINIVCWFFSSNTNNKSNIYFIEGKIICMLREVYNPYLNLNKPQVKKFWLRKLEWFKLFQFEDIQDFMNIAELFKTED